MEINKVYPGDWMNNTLPDKSVQLIIADPPYFEVNGEFDFVWDSLEDYLNDVDRWAQACRRLLADNGTLFWYGSAKKIAYSQIIFDKYFNLINSIVWNKGSFMGLEESDGLKSFAPCTERILMYGSAQMDPTGLKSVEMEFIAPRNPFAIELKRARIQKGVGINDVAEYGKFYGKVNHGGAVTNWEKGYNIPSAEQWKILCDYLPIDKTDYQDLKSVYDGLRKEFEGKRRYFNNLFRLQEVLNFSNESTKTGIKYDHDTVKPETLTRALILTCSRPGDLVLVPFAGSGTEVAMAIREGRNAIGFDINQKYVDIANGRCSLIQQNPGLFTTEFT